jgi:hypothetical protein
MPKIIETLRQDVWWYGQDSFPYRVIEMETQHLVNVLEWLRRRANALRLQHYWDEFLEYNDLDDYDVGSETESAFIRWLGTQPVLDVNPVDWLERTPFVQALKHTLALRGTVDGVVVDVRVEKEIEDDAGTHTRAVGTDPRLRGRAALG